MQKLVVFTGAGISAESGLGTFRAEDGLWKQYSIKEVATPEAWKNDRLKVLQFYNKYRKKVDEARPNKAHQALAMLEQQFDVTIVTQNIDNLHEKAGSSRVIHLHGEIFKARSTAAPYHSYHINGWQLNIGDKCENGAQLRPDVVWFGEPVLQMDLAVDIFSQADLLLIVGTSLKVYPAAELIYQAPEASRKFLVDPDPSVDEGLKHLEIVPEKATIGVPLIANRLGEVIIQNK